MAMRVTETYVKGLPGPELDSPSATKEHVLYPHEKLRVAVSKKQRKTYIFRGEFYGRRFGITIGTVGVMPLAEAREIARQMQLDIERGIDPRIPREFRKKTPYFDQFVLGPFSDFSQLNNRSHDDNASKIRLYLVPEFGQRLLTDITSRDILAYLAKYSEKLSKATLNRHLSLLSRIFRLAIQLGLCEKNPCHGIDRFKESAGKVEFLSIEENKRLIEALQACPYRTSALAILALLYTGMRREEVLQARQENLDLDNGILFLPMTKSGRSKNIQLNSLALEVFKEAAERSGSSPWVFAGRDPSKCICNVRKTYHTVLKQIGLPPMRLHTLRHNYASLLVQQGISLAQVQALLNHSSPSVTQKYAHLADHTLKKATQVFADTLSD